MFHRSNSLVKIGALEAVDFAGPGDVTVIICHGYGADCHDLVPLREEMGLSDKARWIFPQAHLQVEIGPGFFGRAWFPIDLEAHEAALQSGDVVSYAERRPPGMNEARDKLLSLIAKSGVKPENLVLGGFSQGAMLALDAAMVLPGLVRGLALLSGTLSDRAGLRERAPAKVGQSFFQSHGEVDQILPFLGAELLFKELETAGWKGVWCPFRGGHEIPLPVLRNLRSYLINCFGAK